MSEEETRAIIISSDIIADIAYEIGNPGSRWLWSTWFEADPEDILRIAQEVLHGRKEDSGSGLAPGNAKSVF